MKYLQARNATVSELEVIHEDVSFALPRELLATVNCIVSIILGERLDLFDTGRQAFDRETQSTQERIAIGISTQSQSDAFQLSFDKAIHGCTT